MLSQCLFLVLIHNSSNHCLRVCLRLCGCALPRPLNLAQCHCLHPRFLSRLSILPLILYLNDFSLLHPCLRRRPQPRLLSARHPLVDMNLCLPSASVDRRTTKMSLSSTKLTVSCLSAVSSSIPSQSSRTSRYPDPFLVLVVHRFRCPLDLPLGG